MAAMTKSRELFLHELGDILYAERVLTKVLPTMQKEATDTELAAGFKEHLGETRQHIKNIEQVFSIVGRKPKAARCPSIDGIKQEHDTFINGESPSPEVLDTFLTGSGARAEHYEIAA